MKRREWIEKANVISGETESKFRARTIERFTGLGRVPLNLTPSVWGMDIQTINLPISSIRLNHPDGLKEIKISSNKKQTRYTIDTSCLNPESAIQIHILKAHLSVPIRPSRAVGACGWSRLRVQGNSGGDEVSAYRFIVSSLDHHHAHWTGKGN